MAAAQGVPPSGGWRQAAAAPPAAPIGAPRVNRRRVPTQAHAGKAAAAKQGRQKGGSNQHGVASAPAGPATGAAHLDPTALPARASSSSASAALLHMVGRWPGRSRCTSRLFAVSRGPITRPWVAVEGTPPTAGELKPLPASARPAAGLSHEPGLPRYSPAVRGSKL